MMRGGQVGISAFCYKWVALGIAMMCLFVGCATSTPRATTHPIVTGSPTFSSGIGSSLPTFSDWRVAYMGSDGLLHAVTLDGKTDSAGPSLPLALPGQSPHYGNGITNAGIAPDGHTLAYATDTAMVILDPTGKDPINIQNGYYTSPETMLWSPDGHLIAMLGVRGEIDLAKTSDGTIALIPGTPFPESLHQANELDGWIDATHLAVDGFLVTPASQNTSSPFVLYSLDITTAAHHAIAQISFRAGEIDDFAFSPDGTKGFFFALPFRDNPFTPYAAMIDVASGNVIPLPAIAQLVTATTWITNVAWDRGTGKLAVSTGFPINHDLKNWLIDLSTDSVTPLPTIGFPMAWSPDGKTIIWSSDGQNASAVGAGPFTLTAETFGSNGQTTQTVLTTHATNFNFIGFLRTAAG